MSEKRKFARLQQNTPVRHKAEDGEILSSAANDVSLGGIRITTNNCLDIGSCLNVEMNIAQTVGPYYAKGEVVWIKKIEGDSEETYEAGIKFIKLIHKKDAGF